MAGEFRILLDHVVPPKDAYAWEMKPGQYLRIIDVLGKQVGDLVLFNRHNFKEQFSNSWTRTRNFRIKGIYSPPLGLTTGDRLYSTGFRVMAVVTQDTAVPGGIHDLYGRMCNRGLYEMHNIDSRDGCWELLSRVLKPYGIVPEEIADPLNVFMNTVPDPITRTMHIEEPVTKPGDYLELQVKMNLLCAMSTCPMDIICPCNGWKTTPLRVQVLEEE
jgi:hypothetical protein